MSQALYGLSKNSIWTDVTAGLPDSLYPTSVVIHETNEDTVLVTYGGFVDGVKIFASYDAGNSLAKHQSEPTEYTSQCIEASEIQRNEHNVCRNRSGGLFLKRHHKWLGIVFGWTAQCDRK